MTRTSSILLAFAFALAPLAGAQTPGPSGRVSFTAQSFTASSAGQSVPGFSEMVVTAMLASPIRDQAGSEYRFDFRGAGYPQTAGRTNRVSIYDAYVGKRFASGLGVRVGQMWLNDLGGLGALGGALGEIARPNVGGFRRMRVGVFGGLEPEVLTAGYVGGVTKAGGYATFEGQGAWRNTLGFVTIHHAGLTERSVLSTANFLPFSHNLFVYQAAEIDLVGPAGHGSGGLTYLFANGRYSPLSLVELQGVYHRGRSIDVRGITLDQLAGRPISATALEGLLYESIGGRVTITVARDVRIFGGYTKDRNNREDAPTARVTFGGFATNFLHTGLDVDLTDNRMRGPSASYDSWDVSIGRTLGARMYLSGGYSTSLSTFQMLGQEGFLLQTRPRTNRYTLSDLVRLTRTGRVAVLVSADRTRDGDLAELRWLATLMYRF